MNQKVLFQNSVGSLFAIQDNFLYLKYFKSVALQRKDIEFFVTYFSDYAEKNGKFALIVEVPQDITFSEETKDFITKRKYQGKLITAVALVGTSELPTEDSDRYHASLEGVIPSKSFLSFIEAFQWIQQYVGSNEKF